MEMPVHAGRGGVACAAGHARTPTRPAACHQLAFGEEPFSHAWQERLWVAMLAVVFPGSVARSADDWLRRAARPAHAIGVRVRLASARERSPQAGHHSVPPQSFRSQFAMVVL